MYLWIVSVILGSFSKVRSLLPPLELPPELVPPEEPLVQLLPEPFWTMMVLGVVSKT